MSARELDAIFCCPEGCVYAGRTEEDRDALCCKALAGPQMRAALTAAGYAVEQGWQPIDTAPRDGRDVLVWSPDYYGNPVRASWCATVGAWESDVGMMEDGPGIMADECAGPTAWRPLPAPPAGEAK